MEQQRKRVRTFIYQSLSSVTLISSIYVIQSWPPEKCLVRMALISERTPKNPTSDINDKGTEHPGPKPHGGDSIDEDQKMQSNLELKTDGD